MDCTMLHLYPKTLDRTVSWLNTVVKKFHDRPTILKLMLPETLPNVTLLVRFRFSFCINFFLILIFVFNFIRLVFFLEGLRETIVINEEYRITVNAADAGNGFVTCRIMPNHRGAVPLNLQVDNNKDGTFSINYSAKHPDEYKVNVKFGGQLIPNGEWFLNVTKIFLILSMCLFNLNLNMQWRYVEAYWLSGALFCISLTE